MAENPGGDTGTRLHRLGRRCRRRRHLHLHKASTTTSQKTPQIAVARRRRRTGLQGYVVERAAVLLDVRRGFGAVRHARRGVGRHQRSRTRRMPTHHR